MRQILVIVFLLGVVCGCGKDPATPNNSSDMATSEDMGSGDLGEPTDGGGDMPAPVDMGGGDGALCEPCVDNVDCGGEQDLCVTYVEGVEASCAQDCSDDAPCPSGYFCALLDEANSIQQCVPELLTCVDRCTDVACGTGEVCDPRTGECQRALRLCETNCTLNSMCGDGPEDICLNVPGTTDDERACFTGCDPESEESECPADYFCASIDPDNDPMRGVCFPFEGTCVDRCVDVDCPAGENCDPVTGQCSASQFGACDPGCTSNAQCGGQDDLCLNLGIGDGAHCWQDCSGSECPSGYDCRNLLGTTIRVCIPLGNDCSACYDNACFPDSVCDPVADTCEPMAQVCSSDGDCPSDQLCDPISTTCVAVGRPCNGSTWAVDCDNAVTKCTSQRAGVDGTCERLCVTDADCPTGSCTATNLGSFCLGDDLGGGGTCGTLRRVSTNLGNGCNPGNCAGSAPVCVDGGQIDGFCASACTSDASCNTGEICQVAAGTSSTHCIPANCHCAAAVAGGAADTALENALGQLGLSQCDIVFENALYESNYGVLGLPGASPTVTERVRAPLATPGRLEIDAQRLDAAANVAEGIAAAARTNGLTLNPLVRSFTYPGTEGVLAQAIAELVVAAGDTPDLAALDAAVVGVPAAVQTAAAPLVSAVAVEVAARQTLLASLTNPQVLFDGAPFVVLPATGAQAPPSEPHLHEGVAFANELVESADFVGQIPDVATALGALGVQTFTTVSIPTSAGRVIVAGSGDDTHDIAAHGDEIAVLIDLGGDDTYTVPAGANASLQNGVSVLLDLGGADRYRYEIVDDPNDAGLLVSDADGRITPTLPLNMANGPVSASNTARQGAGRLGVGILVDLGSGVDTYESLRMSQGASVLGLGVLWDDGAADFSAEALAQGAAIGGVGVLFAGSSNDDYAAWFAAQGFGALGGVGIAHDTGGDDTWFADPGRVGTVLYLSVADRGISNRNLAQGAAYGEVNVFAGGLGLLRDRAGADTYTAGTFGQGYAHGTAIGALLEGGGADIYEVRGLGQGAGEWRGGGVLREAGGDDQYNPTTTQRLVSHGVGQTLGWGIFVDLAGDDVHDVLPSGGGVGLDGGFGLFADAGGVDTHRSTSDATWGIAQINALAGDPGFGAQTIGVFLDTGAQTDVYVRPNLTGIANGGVWSPGPNPPIYAAGVDN